MLTTFKPNKILYLGLTIRKWLVSEKLYDGHQVNKACRLYNLDPDEAVDETTLETLDLTGRIVNLKDYDFPQ